MSPIRQLSNSQYCTELRFIAHSVFCWFFFLVNDQSQFRYWGKKKDERGWREEGPNLLSILCKAQQSPDIPMCSVFNQAAEMFNIFTVHILQRTAP